MLNVKIQIDDGNGKQANIELSEADNLSKLVIIDKVFRLFGIDSDVFEMVDTYSKIGDAYSSFFNEVQPIEPKKINMSEIEKNEIKEMLIQGLNDNKDELESTYQNKNDVNVPEFVRTGYKISEDGKKRYRVRYDCYACYNRGSHYIHEKSKKTWCHKCRHEFDVFSAHPDGFPYQDTFGNFFRAGEFRDANLNWNAVKS